MSKIEPLEKVEFEISGFIVDFLKTYLEFIGSEFTVSDVCQDMVYDGVMRLRDAVKGLPFCDKAFSKKYPTLSILDSPSEYASVLGLRGSEDC